MSFQNLHIDFILCALYSYWRKEASGRCLFHKLYGVQVVGGSNPLTPISVQIERFVSSGRGRLSPKTVEFTVVA